MTDKPDLSRAVPVPSGRLSRLTRLGTMTAGVAGNMALNGVSQLGQGKRPSMRNLLLTPANVRRITDQLAQMRGAAMKVGQLVSMDTGELLPPELAQIMARLRDDAHFMPPAQLKQVLARHWKDGWLKAFKQFDVRPIAAASIGQVHRAQLRDGRDMAIKVQYPGVAPSIDSDVANVGVLIRMSGLLPSGFDLAPYLKEARKQLHEETDYQREGAYLSQFGTLLQEDARFAVPRLYPDWTTDSILAMEYIASRRIEEAAEQDQDTRDRIAHDLIDLLLRELFEFRLMQTDSNFANYRFDPETGRIVLLDFGATRVLDPTIVSLYRRLLAAGMEDRQDAQEAAAEEIGFLSPAVSSAHRARILTMMEMAFAALRTPGAYDFADTTLSRRMQAEGMALAEDGFIPPPVPIDVLFLQRKFGGVFLLAAKLRARVDVAALMRRHLQA
jgi:predicted unusual protein kinase regulating ubiquinone biosynthesis (AarF/ABC1/UbiB family)